LKTAEFITRRPRWSRSDPRDSAGSARSERTRQPFCAFGRGHRPGGPHPQAGSRGGHVTEGGPIRIVMVDDHQIVREGPRIFEESRRRHEGEAKGAASWLRHEPSWILSLMEPSASCCSMRVRSASNRA
jgi:hypothetical protein